MTLVAQAMAPSVMATYAQQGVLGVTVLVFAGVIVKLWQENRSREDKANDKRDELWNQRLTDAAATNEQLLKINGQVIAALGTITAALDASKDAMIEVQQAIASLAEETRAKKRQQQ